MTIVVDDGSHSGPVVDHGVVPSTMRLAELGGCITTIDRFRSTTT
jgi:hypothetical protein